jgi:hypothetical protein
MDPIQHKVAMLDHRTDSVLSSFDSGFSAVSSQARLRTLLKLRSSLDLEPGGAIKQTAANVRIIRSLPTIFRQALSSSGYDGLMAQFLSSFDGGLTTFEQILDDITDGYKIKPVVFTKQDRSYFEAVKEATSINIEDVVDSAANSARRNVMFTVGGQPFDQTAVEVAERLSVSLGEANTLAATGISTFYRTIADNGYKTIEDALAPNRTLEYVYYGPPSGDPLIRPFCKRLMAQAADGKTWTRAQIDGMDNGQLPDCFRTGGGFNCRHQWVVALEG